MAITYEEVTPTPIENATVRKVLRDGVAGSYYIKANDGYVLHDNTLDTNIYDENYENVIGTNPGYSPGTCSCGINYDWEANPREFYAVLRSEVPADQIFGGG